MENLYWIAESIANNAQKRLDGGLLYYILENYLRFSNISVSGREEQAASFEHHFSKTIGSGGYLAGIFFCVIWCIGLLVGFCVLLWNRYNGRGTRSPRSVDIYDAKFDEGNLLINNGIKVHNVCDSRIHSLHMYAPVLNAKSNLRALRTKLQSNWLFILLQFLIISILVVCLMLTAILGLVVSSRLHDNLTTVFNTTETNLSGANSSKYSAVFPGMHSTFTSTRSYLTEFLETTREDTMNAVENLITDTEDMQRSTALAFNDILFEKIGIAESFELGDKLGAHTVRLMQLALPLKQYVHEYADTISDLNIAIARWTGYLEQITKSNVSKMCLINDCHQFSSMLSDVSIRSDWKLTRFDFAIALNFVTDAQNKTPDSIQAELVRGRDIATRTLEKTLQRMGAELDIPNSIRNLTTAQWDNLQRPIQQAVRTLDDYQSSMIPNAFSTAVYFSKRLLIVGCALWVCMLSIALGVSWMVSQYHCIELGFSEKCRRSIRCAASVGYLVLFFSVIISCVFFVVGGYLQTELCRYVSIDHSVRSSDNTNNSPRRDFVLDSRINALLDRNWQVISKFANTFQSTSSVPEVPLPHIRSPIHAFAVACRENLGILDAFDAIDSFNFSVLNPPELLARFTETGRKIMRDSLAELDINEIFPPALSESVQMASRLDDFLIPFEDVRTLLPRKILNISYMINNTELSDLFTETELINIWESYRNQLNSGGFTVDVISRAEELAVRVFDISSRVTKLLNLIDRTLKDLSKLKPIGSTVASLQRTLESLIFQIKDRPKLTEMAMTLFDEKIATKMPDEVEKLMRKRGPEILREVGRCRRLHEAYMTGTSAACDGVVGPLNGFWFLSGICSLTGVLALALGICLLLRKPQTTLQLAYGRTNIPKCRSYTHLPAILQSDQPNTLFVVTNSPIRKHTSVSTIYSDESEKSGTIPIHSGDPI